MNVAISFLQQFDLLHYLVVLVFALGIGLAYLSDPDTTGESDAAAKRCRSDEATAAATESDGKAVYVKHSGRPRVASQWLSLVLGTKWTIALASLFQFPAKFAPIASVATYINLFWGHLMSKRAAQSRRHYFYLMTKKILNLPVRAGETEVDSYLDIKAAKGKEWPFMWQVKNVKEDKIICEGCECLPFSSYSYLDLLRNPEVQDAAIEAARQWSSGNHGPRMLGGNTKILCDLEEALAKYWGREACLTCATGYLACMSAVAAVSGERTVIFGDARLHASIRAGMKIGQGKVVLFPHNDFVEARKIIAKQRKRFSDAWMIVESVYSMDGDVVDLPSAAALCEEFDLKLIIDEAHGMGVVGKTGRGIEEHFGMEGVATIIMGTFSKSVAAIGGYICGPRRLIQYMDFHAPGNVFSAPLPAYCAGAALKSLELIDSERWRIEKAQSNSKYLRECLQTGLDGWPENYDEKDKYILEGDPATTVIPIVFKDDITRVMAIASHMKKRGFMISAVAFPACPLREPRFRITATTAQSKQTIEEFVRALVDVTVNTPSTRAI